MRNNVLLFVFLIVSQLLFGGLIGYKIGNSKLKMLSMEVVSLKETNQSYKDAFDTSQRTADKCLEEVDTVRMIAAGCCNAAIDELRNGENK